MNTSTDIKLYRVIIKTTSSLRPGRGSTDWQDAVVYCGTSSVEAARIYHREAPSDSYNGYGNWARETVIEHAPMTEAIVDMEWTSMEVEG